MAWQAMGPKLWEKLLQPPDARIAAAHCSSWRWSTGWMRKSEHELLK
jgi:hypothetical protein